MKPKLQKVCNFYLSGMSMREALIKAGYSDAYASHNSSKFLHNRSVMAYIRERQKEIEDAALADDIFLRADLKRIIKDPQSTPYDKAEARKLLEKMNGRDKEIAAKLKEIEERKKAEAANVATSGSIQINFGEVNKNHDDHG